MYAYHDSDWNLNWDMIGLVSENGFKNTGLNNGENNLKCWFKGTNYENYDSTGTYDEEWEPDFE